MAFLIFMLVKFMNKLSTLGKKKKAETVEKPTVKTCPYCCSVIPIEASKCMYCTSELEEDGKNNTDNESN